MIKLTTYRNNVESAVTDFPDLGVLVMHEINEVGRGLCVLDNDLSCRLVEYHLVEDVHDLTHHLVILLLLCH